MHGVYRDIGVYMMPLLNATIKVSLFNPEKSQVEYLVRTEVIPPRMLKFVHLCLLLLCPGPAGVNGPAGAPRAGVVLWIPPLCPSKSVALSLVMNK